MQFEGATTSRSDYNWLYDFKPAAQLDGHVALYQDHVDFGTLNGAMLPIDRLASLAPLLELLARDPVFFQAAYQLEAAFEAHYCCMVCVFSGKAHHEHFEPQPWEYLAELPRYEIAISQAVRSIETLVGKPGKRDDPGKIHRFKKGWAEKFTHDPDGPFLDGPQTYLDAYYEAFTFRNDASHCWRDASPRTRRRSAMQAQALAYDLLIDYGNRRMLDVPAACEELGVPTDLDLGWLDPRKSRKREPADEPCLTLESTEKPVD